MIFIGQLALIDTALFSGAALYITLAEQPARLKTDDRALLQEFKVAYPHGAKMQAPLALIGALLGLLQWLFTGNNLWLFGAIFIGLNWPFTYSIIMPVNKKLISMPENSTNLEARNLIKEWGRLHVFRCGFAITSTIIYLLASLY